MWARVLAYLKYFILRSCYSQSVTRGFGSMWISVYFILHSCRKAFIWSMRIIYTHIFKYRLLLPLFVLTAESHIIRLPCTWDGDFKQVKNKRYSPNYSISNVTANTWSDCCVYCVANSNCTLANYETDEKSCEMIQDSVAYDAEKITTSNSWMILTTKYGSRYVSL